MAELRFSTAVLIAEANQFPLSLDASLDMSRGLDILGLPDYPTPRSSKCDQ
jgi:hypothetical protein